MEAQFNRVVVITGAITDVGLQTVNDFLATGANVIVWSTSKKDLELYPAISDVVEHITTDISNAVEIEKATLQTIEKYKKIDILINNAQLESNLPYTKLDNAHWQKMIDNNLSVLFNTIKHVAPVMIKNQFGRIINVTSLAHIAENLAPANYEAAKSGIKSINRVWARELSKNGITVNAVYMGYIESKNMQTMPDAELESIVSKIPARRLGKAAEVSKTFLFLASKDASYITGVELNIDGGYFC